MLRSMARTSKNTEPALDRETAQDMASAGRFKQIRMIAGMVYRADSKAMPIIIGSGLGTAVILILLGVFVGPLYLFIPLAILFGVLVTVFLFGRFAQSAQYSMIDGQLGAGAAVLRQLRGNWTVTDAVAANRNMDVVHRAVGRPGVVLVGEGSPNGLASLLSNEKKKVARVAYEVPIFEFQVGSGEGQVPLAKLQRKIMRLPRNLKPGSISDINHRLKAIQPTMQAPKGPLPRNIRQPKMPRPKTR